MSQDMVVIAEGFDLNAFYLMRSRLESEEIPVILQNEHVVGLNYPDFLGGPGVQLLVPAYEREHAIALLQDVDAKPTGEARAEVPATTGYRGGLRMLAIVMFLGALGGLLMFWFERML